MFVPAQGDDVGLDAFGGLDALGGALQDFGDGDDEFLAEVAAGVAGEGVGDFAGEVGEVGVGGLGFADVQQQRPQQFAPGGEVDAAVARAGDADDAGEVEQGQAARVAEEGGADLGGAAGQLGEEMLDDLHESA